MFENYNQSLSSSYNSEKLTHVSNYLGIFETGVDYKKFDFVYNTGDGLFYYATDDMTHGGGAVISGSGRFTLDPEGPIVGGRESHYIYDDYSLFDVLGQSLKIGQTIQLAGSVQDASGIYNVLGIDRDYSDSLSSSDGTVLDSLDAKIMIGPLFRPFNGNSVFLTDADGNILDGAGSTNLKTQWDNGTLQLDHADFKNLADNSKIVDGGDVLGLGKDAFLNGWYDSTWFVKSNAGEGSLEINSTSFYYQESQGGWIYHMLFGWVYINPDKQYERLWAWILSGGPNDNKINETNGAWIYANRTKLGGSVPSSNSFIYVEPTYNYQIKNSSDIYSVGLDPDDAVLLQDRAGNNLRDQYDFIDSYQTLEIDSKEFSLLPYSKNFRRRGGLKIYELGQEDFESVSYNDVVGNTGWAYLYKSDNYPAVLYNYTNQEYYGLKNYQFEKTTNESQTPKTKPLDDSAERLGDGKVDRIHVQGISNDISIDEYEVADDYAISLTAINEDPTNSDKWVTDRFFFDADYGATMNFETKNVDIQYENGYYKTFPASINSIGFSANLNFKNRTNREANAIIHFLENHLGQQEKDSTASWLKYSQGISGFRWDGNATFHPYDSIENQTKTFYCTQFNHSLNFEDSNDISLTLFNYDTSILNRAESLFVKSAETYDDSEYYIKDDVVFSDVNNQYYYWHSDASLSGKSPVVKNTEWTRESGLYTDLNKEYWTREFLWKPSLGLNISQQPRMNQIQNKSRYSQLYRNGINESLLEFSVSFNNRSDDEAYAILHFLENHLGYIPFLFSPPPPYETIQNFICKKWNHVYNYKDSHNITATFKQFPFNFEAEDLSNFGTQPLTGPGRLIFTKPVIFASKKNDARLDLSKPFRARMFFENIGGSSITINSISLNTSTSVNFSFLGQASNDVPMIVKHNLNSEDYTYNLPINSTLPFNLSQQRIKLIDNFTSGPEGGQHFNSVNTDGSVIAKFFQRNDGSIYSYALGESADCEYFIIKKFIQNNKDGVLKPGEVGYVDAVYLAASLDIETLLVDENDNNINYTDSGGTSQGNIVLSRGDGYLTQAFTVSSSDNFSPHEGKLQIYSKT